MRLALVCPYSLSRPGGVQTQVLGLARALRRLGVMAQVVAPADAPVELGGFKPVGTSIGVPANGSVAPVALGPGSFARTRSAIVDGSFDIVHVHEPLVPAVSVTAVAISGAPVVGTFHRSGLGVGYRAVGLLARPLMARLARRFAVSEEAASTARRALGGSYVVLENAVDTTRFAPLGPRPPRPNPLVAFLGRHETRKGLPVLLDAFGMLQREAELEVAGEGPETGELRERFAGNGRVRWLGHLDEGSKADLLRRADIVCVPSTGGESFGLVLLEAMAAGAAVIASDLPGYRKVSHHGAAAALVPPGDARALAMALEDLLGDAGGRRRLAEAGLEVAAAHDVSALAKSYLSHYEELAR